MPLSLCRLKEAQLNLPISGNVSWTHFDERPSIFIASSEIDNFDRKRSTRWTWSRCPLIAIATQPRSRATPPRNGCNRSSTAGASHNSLDLVLKTM